MRTLSQFAFLVLVAYSFAAFAADEPAKDDQPKSEVAKRAKAKYDKDLVELDDSYRLLLKKLRDKYHEDLTKSRKARLEANDLDEAQRVVSVMKKLEQETPPVPDVLPGKLTTKDLEGKRLLFSRLGPGYPIVLGKGGRIQGPNNPNEATWKLAADGKLRFYHKDGHVTTVFEQGRVGQKRLYFEGPFLLEKGVVHLLREVP